MKKYFKLYWMQISLFFYYGRMDKKSKKARDDRDLDGLLRIMADVRVKEAEYNNFLETGGFRKRFAEQMKL